MSLPPFNGNLKERGHQEGAEEEGQSQLGRSGEDRADVQRPRLLALDRLLLQPKGVRGQCRCVEEDGRHLAAIGKWTPQEDGWTRLVNQLLDFKLAGALSFWIIDVVVVRLNL